MTGSASSIASTPASGGVAAPAAIHSAKDEHRREQRDRLRAAGRAPRASTRLAEQHLEEHPTAARREHAGDDEREPKNPHTADKRRHRVARQGVRARRCRESARRRDQPRRCRASRRPVADQIGRCRRPAAERQPASPRSTGKRARAVSPRRARCSDSRLTEHSPVEPDEHLRASRSKPSRQSCASLKPDARRRKTSLQRAPERRRLAPVAVEQRAGGGTLSRARTARRSDRPAAPGGDAHHAAGERRRGAASARRAVVSSPAALAPRAQPLLQQRAEPLGVLRAREQARIPTGRARERERQRERCERASREPRRSSPSKTLEALTVRAPRSTRATSGQSRSSKRQAMGRVPIRLDRLPTRARQLFDAQRRAAS